MTVLTQVLGGGTGMQIRGIYGHESLADWRCEVVVLGSGSEPPPRGASLTRLPDIRKFGSYPIGQIRAFLTVRRHIRRTRPHVLHAYFFWPILFGRILKALGMVPRLIENREDEGFNWEAHEYAWLRLTRSVPDRVICVAESVRRCVLQREKLDPGRTTVIHNGVPDARSVSSDEISRARRRLGLEPRQPVVGMVANMNRPVKGVRYFFDAAHTVLEKRPDVRFLLVGGGEDSERHRRYVEELGIAESVIFVGFQEDVDVFYQLMDVSVLASLSEGLSITLLESMAHGLPVVVTRVGGNPEVVEEGATGFLIPPRDPMALAERVLVLIDDPPRREEIGLRARERLEAQFSIDRTARDYARVLTSL